MFPSALAFLLRRPYRQALATVGLVVLTVLPTVYIAGTAWQINRSGHLREVESEIGRPLGLHATLESVSYPRPGEVWNQLPGAVPSV